MPLVFLRLDFAMRTTYKREAIVFACAGIV